MFHVKEFRVSVSGVEMDCISFGTGTKPLIMLQGLQTKGIRGAGASLAYLYRIFAKEYTIYLFDRRKDVWEGITVRDLAADVALAMDYLGISNADVLGVSQGGMIAQYLAIDRPDLVRKLVLAVTLSRNNETVETVIGHWVQLAAQGSMNLFVWDLAYRMYSASYLRRYEPFFTLLTVLQKPRDVQRFTILAKSCLTCTTYDLLDQIRCPVFVIGGKLDQVVGSTASEEIADKLECKRHIYMDLGHAAYEEAKDFNQRVFDFLMEE